MKNVFSNPEDRPPKFVIFHNRELQLHISTFEGFRKQRQNLMSFGRFFQLSTCMLQFSRILCLERLSWALLKSTENMFTAKSIR